MVEGSPEVMVAQRREPKGPKRSRFLPLAPSVLWRTLTHYEILETSHLLSGHGFYFSHSKASGLNVFPDLIPWYLPFYTYCVQVDRHHASLHHITHVFQEGEGLLRAPSPMELGAEVLALGSCLWDFQEIPGFFWSLSARYGQAYSGHTACLPAKSWGRLHLMTIVPGHGFAVVNKNRCSS